jgi:signal transduction histidine kinase
VRREAIDSLVQQTIIFFSAVTLLLVLFANRLSLRLRSLRNQAETAIDKDGRIHIAHIRCSSGDEIGDLARSFSTMLEKLQQYNNYLETVASRLSHELRTPIAVVRSSLENLEQETLPVDSQVYIERAKIGIQRLNTIITRLSEATRLEQALQQADKEIFDLVEVVSSCVSGYRLIYPMASFRSDILHSPLILNGTPDLIAQMLDKLIANAVDFSDLGSPIHILLTRKKNMALLEISNRGPELPTAMQAQLFESMVSLRPKNNQKNAPHLGLGLYIVRLIVNYHGGNVAAKNLSTGDGVIFSIELPLQTIEIAALPVLMNEGA